MLFFPFVQSTGLLFYFTHWLANFSRTSNQAVMLIYEIKWLFKYNQLFLKSKRTLAVLNLFIVFIAAASAIASMRKRNSYDGRNNFNRQPKVCKHTFFYQTVIVKSPYIFFANLISSFLIANLFFENTEKFLFKTCTGSANDTNASSNG